MKSKRYSALEKSCGYSKAEKVYAAKRIKELKKAIKTITMGLYHPDENNYWDRLSLLAVGISAKKDKSKKVGKNERAYIMEAKNVLNDIVEMMATNTPYKPY